MRITEAAQRLGTSPRMLRYRELLGLLPPVREPAVSGALPRDPHFPTRSRPGNLATQAGPGAPASRSESRNPATSATPGSLTTRAWVREDDHSAAGPSMRPAGMRPAGTRPMRGHRRFSDDDLAAVALALRIEQRYDVSPAALAFGLRVLTEPRVRAEVAELGRRIGKIGPPPARALEFEKERALRLLSLARNTHPGR